MATIDLSTLARKTPEGRVDPAELMRTVMAVSLSRVYTGRDAKPYAERTLHAHKPTRHSSVGPGYCGGGVDPRLPTCIAERLASCLACRRPIFVDSPRRPCGARSFHRCPKEEAA